MFNGLSLDQAPPISVVLRFFITLPIFGIVLALLMIAAPTQVLTLGHWYSLGAIHLLFLGVISMGMIGALFQMQSVLGGAPIQNPLGHCWIIHSLLSVGVAALGSAFVWNSPDLFMVASMALGGALIYFATIMLPLLFGTLSHDTLKGMRFALLSLFITATLGVIMAVSYATGVFDAHHATVRTMHYSFGLMGWVAALIIYVAFQVIEMFYVTTPYSDWCKTNVKRILGSMLAFKLVWLIGNLPFAWVFDTVIAVLLTGFVVTTLKRLRGRKRRVSDVSIWFWFAGLGLLMIAITTYGAFLVLGLSPLASIALIAFALFALAILLGMMGKIVPFLVWFHLNAAGFMETPIMSTIISTKRLKLTFWFFMATALLALIAPWYPLVLRSAGILALVLFTLIITNLIMATRLYTHILKTGTKFSFDIP